MERCPLAHGRKKIQESTKGANKVAYDPCGGGGVRSPGGLSGEKAIEKKILGLACCDWHSGVREWHAAPRGAIVTRGQLVNGKEKDWALGRGRHPIMERKGLQLFRESAPPECVQ